MSKETSIEWTDATWNPVTGCTKVSPGCDHCYAERFAERFRDVPGHYFSQGFDVVLRPQQLDRPLAWKRPKRIFVNSMSDLFHRAVPDDYIDQVFDIMHRADWHIYQILTKRAERMNRHIQRRALSSPLPAHIWLGVSVENNTFDWRVNWLRDTPIHTRFISVEPMLGPIDRVSLRGISWVIVGGESGPHHRSMQIDWVRQIRDRCNKDGVAFFFKQWHKAETGRLLDGRTWDELPNVNSLRVSRSA